MKELMKNDHIAKSILKEIKEFMGNPIPALTRPISPNIATTLVGAQNNQLDRMHVLSAVGTAFIAETAAALADFKDEKVESAITTAIEELEGTLAQMKEKNISGDDFKKLVIKIRHDNYGDSEQVEPDTSAKPKDEAKQDDKPDTLGKMLKAALDEALGDLEEGCGECDGCKRRAELEASSND